MIRVALVFVSYFLQLSVYAQWTPLSEWILSGSPEDRIRRTAVNLDTNSVLRKKPADMVSFLNHLDKQAALLKDHDLQQYIQYLQKVSTSIFESDGRRRIRIYEAAFDKYAEKGAERFQAISLHYIGQENFILGNYSKAFESTLKSQRLLKEIGFAQIPEIGKYLHDLALNYYYFREYDKVKELMLESLKYPPYSDNIDIQRYNTLALAYDHLHQPDSAAYHFRNTIRRAVIYKDSTWIALASGNLGSVFAGEKDYKSALPLMMIDYQYNRGNRYNLDMARNAALNIAEVWLHLNISDSARHFIKEVEHIEALKTKERWFGQQQRDEDFQKYYYTIVHRYYLQSGDTVKAYRYLDSLSRITLELDGRYNSMVSELAEGNLENQRYLSEIELEKQRGKTTSLRWLLVFSAVFLVAVILGLLYYLNRVKAARQKAIAESNEHLLLVEQGRIQAAFLHAKKDMMHQLNLLEDKNVLIEKLRGELIALRAQQVISPELLESTISALANARLLTQHDWATFRRSFNIVFNGSLDKIKTEHPDITQSEERIYALTQLDVGTKQMADMLGISPESVRKSKYRLKKRLENV